MTALGELGDRPQFAESASSLSPTERLPSRRTGRPICAQDRVLISLLRGVYEVLSTQFLEFRTRCGVLSTKPECPVLSTGNLVRVTKLLPPRMLPVDRAEFPTLAAQGSWRQFPTVRSEAADSSHRMVLSLRSRRSRVS